MLRKVLNEVYPGNISAMTRGSGTEEVLLLGPDKIFPFDWSDWYNPNQKVCKASLTAPDSTFNRDACVALFPEAYAISYWTHSWDR